MAVDTPRIHLIPPDQAPESVQPFYARADRALVDGQIPGPTLFGNQVRALAHNPALLKALVGVYEAFTETQSIDRRLTELGVLVVSRVNACDYCLKHHTPLAHESGLSRQQLQCLARGDWQDNRALWADDEWLVISYAEQLTREPYKIRDQLFIDMHQHFTDRQIVELTTRLALCSAWNKFNDALGLDTESAFQHAFAEIMG